MAITLRGTASAENTSGDLTVTLPGGTIEDDVVYAGYGEAATSDLDMAMTTSGYTELADLYADDSNDANLGVFRKVMGATPDSTAVFAEIGSAVVDEGVVVVLIGVDTTTPEDAATTTATGINSAVANPPSITTVTDGAWVIAVAESSSSSDHTAPSGYSNFIFENGSAAQAALATKEITTAGAEDPGTMGGDSSPPIFAWAAATVAVRPAGAAAATSFPPWAPSIMHLLAR